MTAREMLNRRVWWFGVAMYTGVAACVVGLVLGRLGNGQPIQAIVLPGFVVAFVAGILGYWFFIRCPRCLGNLAPLVFQYGWRSISPHVKFCPYCGVRMDEDVPAPAPDNVQPPA